MYQIEANISKSKYIEVSDEHLETIRKYSLLKDLIDSNGIVDESVVEMVFESQEMERLVLMTPIFWPSLFLMVWQ